MKNPLILILIFLCLLVNCRSEPQTAVSYRIVQKWSVEGGGTGQRVVIPAEFQTENNLLLICDEIERNTKYEANVYILAHKDDKSAEIQDRAEKSEISDEERKYIRKNFLLSFFKDWSRQNHECDVYPNGLDDENSEKIRKY